MKILRDFIKEQITKSLHESPPEEADYDPGVKMSPRRVATLGDSITASGTYSRKLQSLLPEGSIVKAFGYSGEKTGYIGSMLSNALKINPTDLVVLAGINDIASGQHKNTESNLSYIYQTAKNKIPELRIVAVKLTPWRKHAERFEKKGKLLDRTEKINNWISSQQGGLVDTVVETSSLGNEGYLIDTRDGYHPNKAGLDKLGTLIYNQAFANIRK